MKEAVERILVQGRAPEGYEVTAAPVGNAVIVRYPNIDEVLGRWSPVLVTSWSGPPSIHDQDHDGAENPEEEQRRDHVAMPVDDGVEHPLADEHDGQEQHLPAYPPEVLHLPSEPPRQARPQPRGGTGNHLSP